MSHYVTILYKVFINGIILPTPLPQFDTWYFSCYPCCARADPPTTVLTLTSTVGLLLPAPAAARTKMDRDPQCHGLDYGPCAALSSPYLDRAPGISPLGALLALRRIMVH